SWVTVGAPNFLSIATLRPRGPSVVLTASATVSTPRLSARRASSLNKICFGISLKILLIIKNSGVRSQKEDGNRRNAVIAMTSRIFWLLYTDFWILANPE